MTSSSRLLRSIVFILTISFLSFAPAHGQYIEECSYECRVIYCDLWANYCDYECYEVCFPYPYVGASRTKSKTDEKKPGTEVLLGSERSPFKSSSGPALDRRPLAVTSNYGYRKSSKVVRIRNQNRIGSPLTRTKGIQLSHSHPTNERREVNAFVKV